VGPRADLDACFSILKKKKKFSPTLPAKVAPGLVWDRNLAFVVRGRRLTALAMALPIED
jgi:hypothetical protein